MKIYLACTVRGDRGGVAAGRAMCERLHALGHEVLTTHLLADGVDEAEAALPEADVYRRDLGWLKVAMCWWRGVRLQLWRRLRGGYVLSRAERTGQKAIVLYNTARRHAISRVITGNCDPNCTTVAYSSVEELIVFIDQRFAAPQAV
jgi:hypothetical protein